MPEMSFEQSMRILEAAGIELQRIDESRGAFSMRRFERALNAAMREVDQHYLDTKDHKPAFRKDGRSYYGETKPNSWGGVTVYVQCNRGWFEEGVMRRLIKILNQKLDEYGVNLQGNESWRYSSTKDSKGEYVQCATFNPPAILEVDPKTMFIKGWNAIGSTVTVKIGGKTMKFKHEKQLDSKIRDNGYRQLTGHSSDDLWVSTDRSRAIIVHTSCIHPAAGIDYSARLLSPEETKKYLDDTITESLRDDFERDGIERYNLYPVLYIEGEKTESFGDPYNEEPVKATEIEAVIKKIKTRWNHDGLIFSQYHDHKLDTIVINGYPVIGSEDHFVVKSVDWIDKYKNRNKAWEICWY